MRLEFHAQAREEFLGAVSRYEAEVPGLGMRFVTEVERCIGLLRKAPKMGSPMGRKLRRFALDDNSPFSIVYSIQSDTLLVIAVAHASRRPGYWKQRAKRQ
jgi:hypothetical protein